MPCKASTRRWRMPVDLWTSNFRADCWACRPERDLIAMKIPSLVVFALLAASASGAGVDLLLVNGNFPTGVPAAPSVAAVAVAAGRNVFAGPISGGDPFRAEARQVIGLGGQTVV